MPWDTLKSKQDASGRADECYNFYKYFKGTLGTLRMSAYFRRDVHFLQCTLSNSAEVLLRQMHPAATWVLFLVYVVTFLPGGGAAQASMFKIGSHGRIHPLVDGIRAGGDPVMLPAVDWMRAWIERASAVLTADRMRLSQ